MTDLFTRRRFTGTAAAGVAALLSATRASAQRTPEIDANIRIVNDFCAAFATRDIARPLAYLAEDIVYRMTETTPPAAGHAGVAERLGPFMQSSQSVDFKVLDTWAMGPMVVNHRIDTFASTTRPLVWEGVGVFFLKDGKIREWHDYTISIKR